jgi:hypothetical protein
MKRFTAHSEPWGTFLDVKANAPQVLKKQLDSHREPLDDAVFFPASPIPTSRPKRNTG